MQKILQYLLGTKDFRLACGGGEADRLVLSVMADSDHSACIDSRHSVSGGTVFLSGAAVSWYSRTEQVTALPTLESEHVALNEVTKEVVFLRQVQMLINPSMAPYSIKIFEYSQGGIKLADNPINSKRTKHIDTKHHFIRNIVK